MSFRSVNDDFTNVNDDFRVMLQLVTSLMIIIYNCNMFIAQATGYLTFVELSPNNFPRNVWRHDIQHADIQHNDTQHRGH
jgi:hypothetical protein